MISYIEDLFINFSFATNLNFLFIYYIGFFKGLFRMWTSTLCVKINRSFILNFTRQLWKIIKNYYKNLKIFCCWVYFFFNQNVLLLESSTTFWLSSSSLLWLIIRCLSLFTVIFMIWNLLTWLMTHPSMIHHQWIKH